MEGRPFSAKAQLTALLSQSGEARRDLCVASALLPLARIGLDADDEAATADTLREGLALCARLGLQASVPARGPSGGKPAVRLRPGYGYRALLHVRHMIRARGLHPPERAGECWPWPVRAFTLGVFRRCRELLSIVLGVAPSAETEALVRQSRQG